MTMPALKGAGILLSIGRAEERTLSGPRRVAARERPDRRRHGG